ncbi:hypothetical protein BHE74_00003265 [Ensete ventricosum]|uniref:Uncharacterized protein n=1 Tax=Ensete ventricosum TaxID=4639 RepID=A0A444G8L9_ENSVE|nr:hypothetical protein B296_00018465 [Ensete ventricosum]RWW31216.1 hypothetical protein GW17_00004162 [Ensete ventricosum]RWW87881.1 hypothetical protein BHE74_00003265 [Ensete ventricosum]
MPHIKYLRRIGVSFWAASSLETLAFFRPSAAQRYDFDRSHMHPVSIFSVSPD